MHVSPEPDPVKECNECHEIKTIVASIVDADTDEEDIKIFRICNDCIRGRRGCM